MDGLTNNPHDAVFKAAFSDLSIARELFVHYLPKSIAAAIDWESLQQQPGSFVDPDLRSRHTDLLFSATCKDFPVNLYCLFEHQSRPDSLMPLRMLSYMLRIWEKQAAAHPTKPLPVILPVILYQGRKPWTKPIQFSSLFQLSDALEVHFAPLIPSFQTYLIDLPATSFEQFRTYLSAEAILYLLKAVREERATEHFIQIIENLDHLLSQNNLQLLHTLLTYLTDQTSDLDSNALKAQLSTISNPETRDFVMTLGERLRSEGRREGITKGRREGITKGRREGITKGRQEGQLTLLRRLLVHRFGPIPEWVESQIKNASTPQLEAWFTRILDTDSLEEIFKYK